MIKGPDTDQISTVGTWGLRASAVGARRLFSKTSTLGIRSLVGLNNRIVTNAGGGIAVVLQISVSRR